MSGVFATNPREAPGAVIFRESISMGDTNLSPQQVQALVQSMGQQYRGNRYHLLQRNCNHFARCGLPQGGGAGGGRGSTTG